MKSQKSGFYFLLLASCFLFLIIIAACGRRGDPVLIAPHEEKSVERASGEEETREPLMEEAETETEVIETAQPEAPAGLVAVYTGSSVILAWDEVKGVRQYRVYRSEGDDYSFMSYTVTPAFTDDDIEPGKEYYYKITAVGISEGPASKELKVITKAD